MESVPSPIRNDPRTNDAPLRESVRPEERAAIRIVDDGRERQLSGDAAIDPFAIADIMNDYAPTRGTGSPEQVMKEIDFEWKRYETYGQRDYAEYQTHLQQGWRPVQHANFPGRFAPPGTEGMVQVKDMMLMHRPMRLTVKARQEEYRKATQLMQANRRSLGQAAAGQNERVVLADRSSRESMRDVVIDIPE